MERALSWFLRGYAGVVFAFVFTPIVFSLVFSFNSQRFPTIPLGEFSTQWYELIIADADVWQAAVTSIVVAVCTSLLATLLGFCTAYSDFRYNFRFKRCLPGADPAAAVHSADHHGAGHAGMVFKDRGIGRSMVHHCGPHCADRSICHGNHPFETEPDG